MFLGLSGGVPCNPRTAKLLAVGSEDSPEFLVALAPPCLTHGLKGWALAENSDWRRTARMGHASCLSPFARVSFEKHRDMAMSVCLVYGMLGGFAFGFPFKQKQKAPQNMNSKFTSTFSLGNRVSAASSSDRQKFF